MFLRKECSRSGELRDPLFGVGDALDVGGRGVDEPLQCVLLRGRSASSVSA